MARATAHCTCKHCGEEFVSYKYNCQNRRIADDWEKYAENHFTMCPVCYSKMKEEQKKTNPLEVDFYLGKIRSDGVEVLMAVTSSNSYARREELKDAGFRLKSFKYTKEWCYSIIVQNADAKGQIMDTVHSLTEKLGEILVRPLHGTVCPPGLKEAVRKWVEIKDELQNLGEYPKLSEDAKKIIPEGRWNGKVYGTSGSYAIYISGEKVRLTNDQADIIKDTSLKRAAWKEKYDALVG